MTDLPADRRAVLRDGLMTLTEAPSEAFRAATRSLVAPDAVLRVSAPFGTYRGPDAIAEGYFGALRRAIPHVRRRDLIFMGGDNARSSGGYWVASVTHYTGTFDAPLAGIAPTGHLVFLRAGEFWRIEDGRIARGYAILDIVDLMRQAGCMTLPGLGTEITFPAPATQDGILPMYGAGWDSLALMERMMADLHAYDPTTFHSRGQTGPGGVWADDMMWYGPAGIGSNARWDGFTRDHRAPFLTAFPDRRGGNHYARIGDGNFAAAGGWPSMTMTHAGPYLGVAPTGARLTLNVMDFYRCAGGKLAENWVFLDFVHLFSQMGLDLVARAAARAAE